MFVKPWQCPECRQEFIVDASAVRDTCPWCQTSVEEHDGIVRPVSSQEVATSLDSMRVRHPMIAPITTTSGSSTPRDAGPPLVSSEIQPWWPEDSQSGWSG